MRGELPREKFDAKGDVICQICGKSFMTISPKHLLKHNVTYTEYFLRFPDAPPCNAEFGARTKYRRDRTEIFAGQVDLKKETIKTNDELGDEIIVSEDVGEPTVEVLDAGLEKLTQQAKQINPFDNEKIKILNWLRLFFSNIKRDYMIQVYSITGRLYFEFISDFADPVLKVNVEFPQTFWHNRGPYEDPLRDIKLEEYGWKVIRINSRNPGLQDIEAAIKGV